MKGYTIQHSINLLENSIEDLEARPSGGDSAADVSYDNSVSHLTADDVQEAIDELNSIISLIDTKVHYSSTEHEIGTWIDDSVLYQKTIDLGSNIEVGYSAWTKLTGVTISDILLIVDCKGTNQNGTFGPLLAGITGTNLDEIEVQTPRNGVAQTVRYISLEYTKKPASEAKKTRKSSK